jgi:WD40 repeat protein
VATKNFSRHPAATLPPEFGTSPLVARLYKLGGFRCSVKAVGFSPDAKIVAASGNDGMLKLWDVKDGDRTEIARASKLRRHRHVHLFIRLQPRMGRKIYAGNGDGTISEWDVESGKETKVWQAHRSLCIQVGC